MNPEFWDGQRILVVDDSSTARAMLRHLFKGLPISLEMVSNAEQFLERLAGQAYDLVLLDYRLPDGDGMDLTAECRRHCPAAAVMLITGKADTHTATEALSVGADGYLDKRHLKDGSETFLLALKKAMVNRQRVLAEGQLQALRHEFHSVITHDLRAPAASASVALRMFKESREEAILDTAMASLDRFFERLDRLQDYMRMGESDWRIEPEPCDFEELVDEVVRSLRPLALSKQQQLLWEPGGGLGAVELDAGWVSQAVENLLGNAIKYTQAGGSLRVECGEEPGWVWLSVADDGPGVPEDLRPALFQRFYRAPQHADGTRGVGLGLAIVQRVVEAHQGRIGLESGPGGVGLVFRLRFPRAF